MTTPFVNYGVLALLAAILYVFLAPSEPQQVVSLRLSDIFYNNTQVTGTGVRCKPNTTIYWYNRTWTAGGVHAGYYHGKGRRSVANCRQDCYNQTDCHAFTVTGSGQCYLLTTSEAATCRYLNNGHYNRIVERCTPRKPCPTGYKICSVPQCLLTDMARIYCKTKNQTAAITNCNL